MNEPIAWLLRETKHGESSIPYGKMFKTRSNAEKAAKRRTNRWRTYTAVPVVELEIN